MATPFAKKLTGDYWRRHPERVHWPIGTARVGAEIGSLLFATQVVPLLNAVAPGSRDSASETLTPLVAAHLGWYRKHVVALPAFSSIEKQVDAASTDHDKAKLIAGALVDFSLAMVSGTVGQIATQAVAMKMTGLPDLHAPGSGFWRGQWEHTRRLAVPLAIDQVTNVALVGVMQGVCPKTTKDFSDSLSDLLQKTLGIRPEATRYSLQWMGPKFAGMAASTMLLNRAYREHLTALPAASR